MHAHVWCAQNNFARLIAGEAVREVRLGGDVQWQAVINRQHCQLFPPVDDLGRVLRIETDLEQSHHFFAVLESVSDVGQHLIVGFESMDATRHDERIRVFGVRVVDL